MSEPERKRKTKQGVFKPRNFKKYKGNPTNIQYRSGWELQMMFQLDKDPNILEWSSEELPIAYRSPLDNKLHRYFPDFYIKKRLPNGTIEENILEVKPLNESLPPKPSKNKKSYEKAVKTYVKNRAKWEAALKYCKNRGYKFFVISKDKNQKFMVLNEDHLGLGK